MISRTTAQVCGELPGLAKLWLLVPTLVVAIAMLYLRNAWLAMIAFHGTMAIALIVHRRRLDWRKLFQVPAAKTLLLHLPAALIVTAAISWAMVAYANRQDGYGGYLDDGLNSHRVSAATRLWFAAQLCLLNPLLEELFWRGLFFCNRKRPAATDFCYAAFHFFALYPFMPSMLAALATLGLAGFGYFLRQLARQQKGSLLLALLWHVLGDVAAVLAIARLSG